MDTARQRSQNHHCYAVLVLLLLCLSAGAQLTPWANQFLNKPNALSARAYLGVNAFDPGSNVTFTVEPNGNLKINASGGGGGGIGTVTSFSAGGLSPLFTSTVATASTTPALSFAQVVQNPNLVFAGPASGPAANPTFRSLVASDIPSLAYVTSVGLSLPSIFTVTVSPVTSSGTLTATLANESANLVFAGPSAGVPAGPTFRSLVAADIPALSYVPTSRNVNTTAPLAGGGALSADLTLTISDFVASGASHARGTVPDPGASSGTTKFLREDATWQVPPGGGGGGTWDFTYPLSQVTSSGSGTNFIIDFSKPAQYWAPTGSIALRFSTNWPSTTSTALVARVFIAQTNYARTVYLFDAATNWQTTGLALPMSIPSGRAAEIKATVYGQQETNVFATMQIANATSASGEITFNPTSVAGLLVWVMGDVGVCSDAAGTAPVTSSGTQVRCWKDQSGNANNLTNATATTIVWSRYGAPNNHGSVVFPNAVNGALYLVRDGLTTTQPAWFFGVYRLRGLLANTPNLDYLCDGGGTAVYVANVSSGSPANALTFSSGTAKNDGTAVQFVWSEVDYNNASGSAVLNTNGVAALSGQNIGAGTFTRVSIGCSPQSGQTQSAANIEWAEVLLYNANLSGANVTAIQNYLIGKYSVPN